MLHRVGLKAFLRTLPHTGLINGVGTYLGAHRGRLCSSPEIIDWVYGEHEDGGPDNAPDCVRIAIMRLQRMGAPIATTIERGYRMTL